MNRYKTIALTGGLLISASASAFAQTTWMKTGNPGNTPATAQVVTGVGPLTAITGSLTYTVTGSERTTAPVSNPDMFEIYLDGGGTFSATTVGTDGTLYDSALYLFDSTGKGVYSNDDDAGISFGARSTLPAASTYTPLTPGYYFLAIGAFGALPYSVKSGSTYSYIFPSPSAPGDFSGVFGPTGSGGTKSVIGWNLTGDDIETGSYTIALTGASFVPAPEPSALLVLLVGAGGLTARMLARRRAKDAPLS